MPRPCLERFASRPLKILEGARHDGREATVVLGEGRQAVERPGAYEFLRVLDILAEDQDDALPFPRRPAQKGQGADNLKSDFPLVAVRETADEQLLVWLYPVGVFVGDLLEQIDGAHRHQPVGVLGERGEFGHALRCRANQREHLFRLCDRSPIAA